MTSNQRSYKQFKPALGLKNTHVQTIFSSVGPRKALIARRFRPYLSAEQVFDLDGGQGVRLTGIYNKAVRTKAGKLAILIHGWEGSHQSTYMQSMAMSLLEQGVDVFRLNLRDHGDTHHLNEGVFNSTLIDEVMNAVENLQARLVYPAYHLIGFSLGGNFSLRLAAMAHSHTISLSSVIAFCPAIHAAQSNVVLNQTANWVYGQYFVRKWKRSLRKKLEHWPNYTYGETLDSLKTLDQMNQQLIPKYTAFKSLDDYFDAYAISGDRLDKLIAPCHLYFAEDDMIIPVAGVKELSSNPNVHVTVTKHGGHCGYISNWRGDCWQDQTALDIILNS